MAEMVKVNFGWLNDFSGAKFAPLTLSDKILMLNGDKTLDEYLNEITTAFNNRHTSAEDNIDVLKATLKAIEDPYGEVANYPKNYFPGTVGNRQNLNSLILSASGAQRLMKPDAPVSKEGKATEEAFYETHGLRTGGPVLPVYFNEGLPVTCNPIVGSPPSATEDADLYIELESDNYGTDFYNSIGISGADAIQAYKEKYNRYDLTLSKKESFHFDEYDGNAITDAFSSAKNGLNVNILGHAGAAVKSLFSYQSGLARHSIYADHAVKADTLMKNIQFSELSNPYGADTSDIHGLIDYSSSLNNNFAAGLKLRDILNVDGTTKSPAMEDGTHVEAWFNHSMVGNGFGANTATTDDIEYSDLNKFFVPHIEVDTTGRITQISHKPVRISLDISHIEGVTSPTEAAVVGWTNGNKFYHTGSGANGIYISWKDDPSNPVLMGAAWNDYAEFRKQKDNIPAGYCVASNDNGEVYKTTKKLQACDGIVSDTFGFSIGKSESCQTPVAVSGRVLAYYEGDITDYHSGDTVCAGPEGKVMKMTREEIREWPDRIVGIVSEIPSYEEWNNTPTKNRIWIKVK